ncbi:hypothetical protein RFI_33307, partial [Reticulomyxa filosa]
LWLLQRDDLLHMNEELLSVAKEELQVKPTALKKKQQEASAEEKDDSEHKEDHSQSKGVAAVAVAVANRDKFEEEWMKLFHSIENQVNMFQQTIQLKFHLQKQLQDACKNTNSLARLALHTRSDIDRNSFADIVAYLYYLC